ncbi:VOC family protein [Weissella minor]|uniref:VOC family protein n=1 Tax=Weissella minor TaxID=1620 RepID=UPI003AF2DDA6
MRVSSFSTYNIPVANYNRAVRFYREVFDLPSNFGAHEETHLSFQGQPLAFIDGDPITLNIQVQDTPQAIENHLINYEVEQNAPVSKNGANTVFHIEDFEGNQIKLSTTK